MQKCNSELKVIYKYIVNQPQQPVMIMWDCRDNICYYYPVPPHRCDGGIPQHSASFEYQSLSTNSKSLSVKALSYENQVNWYSQCNHSWIKYKPLLLTNLKESSSQQAYN